MDRATDLDAAVASARGLVVDRFPGARAAWLAGSVVTGTATPGSDLDVTVLLPGEPAPYRESMRWDGWPVELFVHTERRSAGGSARTARAAVRRSHDWSRAAPGCSTSTARPWVRRRSAGPSSPPGRGPPAPTSWPRPATG